MQTEIPPMTVVRARLLLMRDVEIDRMALDSGVPASTIRKIRQGVTPNPGFETVRKFFHLLPPTTTPNQPQAAQPAEQGVANA